MPTIQGAREDRKIKYLRFLTFSTVLFLASALLVQAKTLDPQGSIIPGKFIIQLEEGSSPEDLADELAGRIDGFKKGHVFSSALNGFSVEILAETKEEIEDILKDLKGDLRILSIEPDRVVAIPRTIAASGNTPSSSEVQASAIVGLQPVPPGIQRIKADLNPNTGAGIDIAIIDTGIDLDHPDLLANMNMNIEGHVSFIGGTGTITTGIDAGNDDNGHGTHVAGIAAAIDNNFGVVGVAPEARLWAIKVLDAAGVGQLSDVIAGVEYAATHGIKVANMSLSVFDPFPSIGIATPLCTAIVNATAAGVTFVAGAGNWGWPWPADFFSPGNCPGVITVSAMIDTDGIPGGGGPPSTLGADDSFAFFSNVDLGVDIAAPGVDIRSTWIGGGYNTISGTSMSTPHVTGAAALYLQATPGATPADVKAGLIRAGFPQHGPEGFTGDPDHDHIPPASPETPATPLDEPLVNAAGAGGGTPSAVNVSILVTARDIRQGRDYRIKAELINKDAAPLTVTATCSVLPSGSESCGPPIDETILAGGKVTVSFKGPSTLGVGPYEATVSIEGDSASPGKGTFSIK